MSDPAAGLLLRQWRERRRLSQLELSLRAEVSTRHLSYLETGRSRPTADMVHRLARHLEVPLRERNRMLLAAGHAPAYAESGLDEPALAAVRRALRSVLTAHEPYPAVLLDRWWDLVEANSALAPLLAGVAGHLLEPPVNVLRLSLHPDGLAPRIRNLDQWRGHLLDQLRHRVDDTGDARLVELEAELAGYPTGHHVTGHHVTGHHVTGPAREAEPGVVLGLRLQTASGVLSFFSIASRLTDARDVTLEELTLETFYPADEATAALLAGAGGAGR